MILKINSTRGHTGSLLVLYIYTHEHNARTHTNKLVFVAYYIFYFLFSTNVHKASNFFLFVGGTSSPSLSSSPVLSSCPLSHGVRVDTLTSDSTLLAVFRASEMSSPWFAVNMTRNTIYKVILQGANAVQWHYKRLHQQGQWRLPRVVM